MIVHKEASAAMFAIVDDLSDRRGLRQAWESIDDDIRAEIVAKWEAIIDKAISDARAGDWNE